MSAYSWTQMQYKWGLMSIVNVPTQIISFTWFEKPWACPVTASTQWLKMCMAQLSMEHFLARGNLWRIIWKVYAVRSPRSEEEDGSWLHLLVCKIRVNILSPRAVVKIKCNNGFKRHVKMCSANVEVIVTIQQEKCWVSFKPMRPSLKTWTLCAHIK